MDVDYYEEYIRNSRGVKLFTCRWLPSSSPKALVFLCHGYGMECSDFMKGQRRHTTTQAAAPTLNVLLHDPIRTVDSWGLPNADCSTKSAILSKNSNVFNEYGDTMRFGVKEPKLLFTGNRDYGLIKNNGQRDLCLYANLAPTAEQKMFSQSPCYRREPAGAYKEVR